MLDFGSVLTGSIGISTRGSPRRLLSEFSGDSGASRTVSGDAGHEAGDAGVSVIWLLEDGDCGDEVIMDVSGLV